MIITITIDTDAKTITPISDDTTKLVHYLLEQLPTDFGRYYGLLAKKVVKGDTEAVAKNAMAFVRNALEAYTEE